ncbi:MAG: type III secretion system outer membrane ring subunit SctC [Kiritimatiellae bacterium]|nr:type III secretion system outer membrane ring subunit SctC [Kiritimatiellia bacterium]
MKRLLSTILLAGAALLCPPSPDASRADPIPWKVPEYTLVARGMDLRTALDTFATAEGLSVVMSPSVQGVFSGDFRDVPAGEFLDRLATVHNLSWYYDGAALYIYGAGEIQSLLLDLRYMKAGELRAMLAELGVEDERFPLRTTSDGELIMASGPPRYVALVAEMVRKADALRELRTHSEVETWMFPLKHTWADDVSFSASGPESSGTIKGVASLLEEIMEATIGAGVREAGTTNAPGRLEESLADHFRPVITAENRLNAVIVRDIVSRRPMYERLIRELDVPQKLVEIHVTVVELSKNDALDWQLSLQFADSGHDISGAAGMNAANLFAAEDLAGKGLAGALTHIHDTYALSLSLTALRQKGRARSISRTSLLTVNNLAAEMTDTQSYRARVIGTEVATLEEVSAGTKLSIKPRIIPSEAPGMANQIWLSMELDDGGFEAITVDAMPMTRSSTLLTQTAVFENESIMLAGYLRDIDEDAGWGIPYLRDLPLIGWLFGGASREKTTVQRMFILTPHVVDADTEMLARLQSTRLRDITDEEQLEDDAEASDAERARRALERADTAERRREQDEDRLARRRAELNHEREMRQLRRRDERRRLKADEREWRLVEAEEAERVRQRELEDAANAGPEPVEEGETVWK